MLYVIRTLDRIEAAGTLEVTMLGKLKIGLTLLLVFGLAGAALAQGFNAPPPEEDSTGDEWTADVAVGAVSMEGKTWQQISLRPDIPIGKFGIALDISIYFDEDGNIRESDWDEAADYIDKIYYLRYGRKGDPFYLKAGALDNVTLGYGILMKYYSNTVDYPSVKRVGTDFEWRRENFRIEGMFNNFRELDDPGLFGARASYPLGGLRLGAALVMDGNQYASYHDTDDDGVPDELDRFPDSDDASVMGELQDLYNSNPDSYDGLQDVFGWPDPGDLGMPVPDYSDAKEDVKAWSVDVGYPFLDEKLIVYAQFAQFVDYGTGFAMPGLLFKPWPILTLTAEYRDYNDQFVPSYFSRTYEIERYTTSVDNGGNLVLVPRSLSELAVARAASGIYADFNIDLFNLLTVFGAYSSMKPKDAGVDSKSLYGSAKLNVDRVPKISELSAYYQQTNVEKILDLWTESSLYGARVGYEMSPGVNLILNYRWTFRDLNGDGTINDNSERFKTFAIETSFAIH